MREPTVQRTTRSSGGVVVFPQPAPVRPQQKILALVLLYLLHSAACSETVGFLSLDLILPSPNPPLVCDGDPRRPATIEMIVTHKGGTSSSTFTLEDPPTSLTDIPLGEITIDAYASNRLGVINRSGRALATLVGGNNAPVNILLLEDSCSSPICDGDLDTIANDFEEAMGTDPDNPDTDGDGLEDGLEAKECCSDPLSASDQACQNLIQRIIPSAGQVGDPVMIKAATIQTGASTSLGGAPLVDPLMDGLQIHGFVGPTAVLGEVALSAEGQTSIYRDLFAVLNGAPVRIPNLDRQTGATSNLIANTIDMVHFDNQLHILGQSQSAPGHPSLTILLVLDRKNQKSWRIMLPPLGKPVALAIGPRWGAVLFQGEQDLAKLVLYDNNPNAAAKPFVIPLPLANPISIQLEPTGDAALILSRSDILRVSLTVPGQNAMISLRSVLNPAVPSSSPSLLGGCTGMAYLFDQAATNSASPQDSLYLACNLPTENCQEPACNLSGAIFQLSPLTQCLPLTGNIPGADLTGSCWVRYPANSLDQVRDAPIIDQQAQKIYQLVTSGLAAIDTSIQPSSSQPLVSHIQYRWRINHPTSRSMAINQAGQLFVADGTLIWRLLPRQSTPLSRLGSSFNPAEGADITRLALSTDNTVLDLGTFNQGMIEYLTTICLNRCKDCLCDQN